MKHSLPFLLGITFCFSGLATAADSSLRESYGPKFSPGIAINRNVPPTTGLEKVHRWNLIAINATGLDHTPTGIGDPHVFGEQLGPCRAARAMAIIHIAIHDALNAAVGNKELFIDRKYKIRDSVSADAAIAQGAHRGIRGQRGGLGIVG